MIKRGFIQNITTEYRKPVTLTSDQITMLTNNASSVKYEKSVKIITVIDLKKKTAETFSGYDHMKHTIKNIDNTTLYRYIDKDLIYVEKYLFINGFIEGITIEIGKPVNLTNDQFTMLTGNAKVKYAKNTAFITVIDLQEKTAKTFAGYPEAVSETKISQSTI
jgi:hypothetical protein